MRIKLFLSLLVVFLFCFESIAEAQGRRGGGQRGVSRTALAQVEAVQSELEVTDEQKTTLAEMRGQRGERGRGQGRRGEGRGEGEGKRGEGQRGEGQRGQRGQRGGQGRGGQTLEQVQEEVEKLSEVLLEHQMTRLTEIYVQVMGQRAIQDPVISEALEITEDQKSEMQEIRDAMREEMMSMRDTVEREEMREKMTELTEQTNEKLMAVLNKDQNDKLDEMKGEEFEMPEDALQRGRRGRDRGRSDF